MQRHGVGVAADVAGDHRHRAELAHRAGVAQDHAVEQAPLDVGQRDAPEGLPAAAPSDSAASSSSVPCACISGISSRATKGKVTKIVASTMPGHGEDDLDVVRREPRPEPALGAEQQHVDQAGDHRRDRERQVDQRDQEALAGELELGDRPGRGEAEDEVQRHRDRRGRAASGGSPPARRARRSALEIGARALGAAPRRTRRRSGSSRNRARKASARPISDAAHRRAAR